jgi:hypothetical protein
MLGRDPGLSLSPAKGSSCEASVLYFLSHK